MTQHVTISLDDQELGRARALADSLGVSVEEYLQRLIAGHLPKPAPAVTARGRIEDLFDLVTEGEPTDIGRDKDKLIGEAIIKHHLEETGQA